MAALVKLCLLASNSESALRNIGMDDRRNGPEFNPEPDRVKAKALRMWDLVKVGGAGALSVLSFNSALEMLFHRANPLFQDIPFSPGSLAVELQQLGLADEHVAFMMCVLGIVLKMQTDAFESQRRWNNITRE